ncbi:MAG: hypothetical protein JW703_00545, partial [Candidatus Diapherotrites archaeon]|nr:hypothetical protein [Candidatus Diapherotrites archaeon]
MNFNLNSRGQEFSVFELLVQAVIGLFILVIIISSINYFDEQRYAISKNRFDENLVFAAEQPNGDVLKIDEVAFNSGSISSKYIELRTGINADCIRLQAKSNPYIIVNEVDSLVSFEKSLVLDVYIKCF